MILTCPYCNGKAKLDTSKRIYQGRDYGLAYICENYPECDSYVGTHKNTETPLGRLANKELRDWKIKAHAAFDEIWKSKKVFARGAAYKWLAKELGINKMDCHIGMFDIDMCKKVIEICAPHLQAKNLKRREN